MKKLFENWRKHTNEAWEPKPYNKGTRDKEDVYIDKTRDNRTPGQKLRDKGQHPDQKKMSSDERHADFRKRSKYFKENEYEPGHAVADIDTGEERMEPEMAEKEAMEDLAEKFGVEVEFSTTKKGEPIAIVTFEDGEQIGYRDEEEMYQDLAKRYEMSEGIENITPENVQIAADALRQVATNFAPAIIIPAIMMIYQEYKDKKKADK